jgi:ribosomal protein S18 acetylase RimI-like enzyme
MMDIIRNGLTQELEAIIALTLASYQEYSLFLTPEHWAQMQANISKIPEMARQGRSIVAESAGNLIGAVLYYPPKTSEIRLFPPEWASLRMLAVLPQYRNRGIGRRLSWECIDRAKQDKAQIIGVHTSELMATARRMYEQLGFKQDIELPRNLGIRYWRYMLPLVESEKEL